MRSVTELSPQKLLRPSLISDCNVRGGHCNDNKSAKGTVESNPTTRTSAHTLELTE